MSIFYFKSYDKTVGSANNLEQLKKEISRLAKDDSASVEYHLREGHIVRWLNDIGEKEAANSLRGVSDLKTAMLRLGIVNEKRNTDHEMEQYSSMGGRWRAKGHGGMGGHQYERGKNREQRESRPARDE